MRLYEFNCTECSAGYLRMGPDVTNCPRCNKSMNLDAVLETVEGVDVELIDEGDEENGTYGF